MNKQKKDLYYKLALAIVAAIFLVSLVISFGYVSAVPWGPRGVNITDNETRSIANPAFVNTSGGYVATLNMTAIIQNLRWKAFVGWVSGKFTLDDSSGSTIYDWALSGISGEIYATMNSTTVSWTSINCSNTTLLEAENNRLSHTTSGDNISSTFSSRSHNTFWVAANPIYNNTCPSLRTYVNNATQASHFNETVLYDGASLVYSTIIENRIQGFDSNNYDFQMIVPENGSVSFTGASAYYLYVEVN